MIDRKYYKHCKNCRKLTGKKLIKILVFFNKIIKF